MDFEKLKQFTKPSLFNCTWEKEGSKILSDDKLMLNMNEKEKIKFLISKCSPDNTIRRKLWFISSGAKKEMKNNRNYYQNLLKLAKSIKSLNEHQINVDLNRTFPEVEFFQKEENIKKLENILICYSIRNSSIGYCQGFNFIVARLLEIFEVGREKEGNNLSETESSVEEEVFWMFTQVIEEILPINYYSELAGMITDCAILVNFLEKYLPDLYKFLMENNFELSLDNFIHKWFVSFFVQNFQKEICVVIWDFFFLEGNIVLFKAALAVLKILKKDIMEDTSFEQIYYVLNDKTNELSEFPNVYSDLIFYLAFRKFEFDSDFLDRHRKNLQVPIIENIKRENEAKLKMKIKAKEKEKEKEVKTADCDLNLPFCIKNIEQDFQHKIIYFIPLKTKNFPPKIVEDFFGKNYHYSIIHNFKKRNSKIDDSDDILIERHTHTCTPFTDEDKRIQHSNTNLISRKSKDSTGLMNSGLMDSLENSTDDGINWNNSKDLLRSLKKRRSHKRNKSDEQFETPMTDNIYIEELDADDKEYMNLYKNIKRDKNFTLANNFLTSTFIAKPFDL